MLTSNAQENGKESPRLAVRLLTRTWLALKKDRLLYLAIFLYIAFSWMAADLAGVGDRYSVLVYPETTITVTLAFLGGFFVVYGGYVIVMVRPASPLSYMFDVIWTWLSSEAMLRALFLVSAFTFFFSAVSSFKTLIPAFQPFTWDPHLAALDQQLHGGLQPWQILQPLLGSPPVTFVLNFFYNLWFFVMFVAYYWQVVWIRNEALRSRFLLSFILCWAINGSILAVIFSSVGPCFYGRFYPDLVNPYAGLMSYLKHANDVLPIWALPTQNMLWDLHLQDKLGVGAGISAMPSMHISIAWLIFMLSRQGPRWLAWLGGTFFVLIFIGSILLGWHYAVDGYLSVIVTTLIWFVVKKGHEKYFPQG
ncbi:MAG: phosphatase PAP2 family protein [Alcanivorax sp.]|nr:phosphatase PAP2 family protein [Alcanivorax sp.]